MGTHTTLDRFGRIVIPRAIRDHLGVAPGSALAVEEHADGVLLKPTSAGALRDKGGVLVFCGEVAPGVAAAVRSARSERLQRFLPRRRK